MIDLNQSRHDSSGGSIFSLKNAVSFLLGISVMTLLFYFSTWNYPLFHTLAEMFSIVIAFTIFVLAWNSRSFIGGHYLLFLGVSYLFVAVIDLFHIVTYYEMGVFQGIGANSATQLWVAARYLQSISLVIAAFFIRRKLNLYIMIPVYGILTVLLILSIMVWGIFPNAYLAGSGLTHFKIISEDVITFIFLISVVLLVRNKDAFEPRILRYLIASIVVTIFSEVAFTLYRDVTGVSNAIGHLLKIGAYFLAYKALIDTSIKNPFDLLFRNLKQSQDTLTSLNEKLIREVEYREHAEKLALQNEQKYKILFTMMTEGFALNELILDENGEPCDFRFLEVNESLFGIMGRFEFEGKTAREVLSEDKEDLIRLCGQVVLTGNSAKTETYNIPLGKWFEVYIYATENLQFVTLFDDITEQKQTEEEVVALAKFPSENPNIVLRVNGDGTVIYSNNPGYDFLEYWGTGMDWLLPEEYRKIVEATLSKREKNTVEVDFADQVLSLVFTPVSGEGYVNIYGSDITEQKRNEEALRISQRDLEKAQKVSLLGSWRLNFDTNMVTCSDEAYRIFEIPLGTILTNERLMENVHTEDREFVDQQWADALLGEAFEFDHRLITVNGLKWVRQIGEIEFNDYGEPVSAFGTIQDITDIKKAEQMKDEFIGLISHELRTPLTIIIGSLRSSMSEGISPEDVRELLENAIDGAESLAAILENMLELSRYQANRLQLEFHPVNVRSVVENVISRLQDQNVQQTFVVEIPSEIPHVKADPLRVERILYNLIENATKYSPDFSEIKIRCKDDGEYIVTEVIDHGEGISSADMDNLFESFQRFSSSTTKSGLGLGLVVCKRLVEVQKGWIDVRSNPGEGSVFCFGLPVEKDSGLS